MHPKRNLTVYCDKALLSMGKLGYYISLLLIILFVASACKKDNSPDWSFCDGCGLEAWLGHFEGQGTYYLASDGEHTQPTQVLIDIINTYDDQLQIRVVGADYYSEIFSSVKNDNKYYISMGGTTRSLQLNLYEKEGAFRMTGISKKYHVIYDPSLGHDVEVIDEYLSFEVFKQAE